MKNYPNKNDEYKMKKYCLNVVILRSVMKIKINVETGKEIKITGVLTSLNSHEIILWVKKRTGKLRYYHIQVKKNELEFYLSFLRNWKVAELWLICHL